MSNIMRVISLKNYCDNTRVVIQLLQYQNKVSTQAASLLKWFFKMRTLFFYFSFLRNVNLKWIILTNDIAYKEKKMNFSKIKT